MMGQVAALADVTRDSCVFDMESGIGVACMQLAALTGCKAFGFEFLRGRTDVADALVLEFKRDYCTTLGSGSLSRRGCCRGTSATRRCAAPFTRATSCS